MKSCSSECERLLTLASPDTQPCGLNISLSASELKPQTRPAPPSRPLPNHVCLVPRHMRRVRVSAAHIHHDAAPIKPPACRPALLTINRPHRPTREQQLESVQSHLCVTRGLPFIAAGGVRTAPSVPTCPPTPTLLLLRAASQRTSGITNEAAAQPSAGKLVGKPVQLAKTSTASNW